MDHFLALLIWALTALFGLVVAAIDIVETAARHALAAIGITGEIQTVLLLILLVLLIIAAFRVFGRLFAFMIALVLVLLLLHALLGPSAHGLQV
jgi:hypothetical protein